MSRVTPAQEKPIGSAEDAELRKAAVLLLLYPRDGKTHFTLILRPDDGSAHGGQVALPGGRWEEGDASLWDTALRETREELGIETDSVQKLTPLRPVRLYRSGHLIAPFVGWLPQRPTFAPNSDEVAALVEVPLADLMNPSLVTEGIWERREALWRIGFFRLGDHQVWGGDRAYAGGAGGAHG